MDRHRIVNIDIVAEHAAIANIAVVRLAFIKIVVVERVLRNIEIKLARACKAAIQATEAAFLARRTEIAPFTEGAYFNGLIAQPPVGQIEMMCRLMDEQPAAVAHMAMPSPEILCAMIWKRQADI